MTTVLMMSNIHFNCKIGGELFILLLLSVCGKESIYQFSPRVLLGCTLRTNSEITWDINLVKTTFLLAGTNC